MFEKDVAKIFPELSSEFVDEWRLIGVGDGRGQEQSPQIR